MKRLVLSKRLDFYNFDVSRCDVYHFDIRPFDVCQTTPKRSQVFLLTTMSDSILTELNQSNQKK